MPAATASCLEPSPSCAHCARLTQYRTKAQLAIPNGHNAPVPSFGNEAAKLLIVGLAPGLMGANRTGRPFTGDGAGVPLYACLARFQLSVGNYGASADDGLTLHGALLTNAVRCAPPHNKPTPQEIKTCNAFLRARLYAMGNLSHILALGRIAHEAVLTALGVPRKTAPFAHGAFHILPRGEGRTLTLCDSYHCSRYNLNTGVLTQEMLADVFAQICAAL